jgi:hypothetical protein
MLEVKMSEDRPFKYVKVEDQFRSDPTTTTRPV